MGAQPPHGREPDPQDRLAQLFRSHYAAVLAYARRRAPTDAVEDVVSETFAVAWRRLDRVPDEPLPWLLAVARNVLATQRRSASRRGALALRLAGAEPAERFAASPAPPDGPIAEALSRLAVKDREALTLVAWEGLEPREAARVLGEAAGTFRVRLYRARRRMRHLLEDEAQQFELRDPVSASHGGPR